MRPVLRDMDTWRAFSSLSDQRDDRAVAFLDKPGDLWIERGEAVVGPLDRFEMTRLQGMLSETLARGGNICPGCKEDFKYESGEDYCTNPACKLAHCDDCHERFYDSEDDGLPVEIAKREYIGFPGYVHKGCFNPRFHKAYNDDSKAVPTN